MTTTIPMMKLRSEPGTVFDRVFYRKESFVVEKAGEPRGVIVPMEEYEEILRLKKEAKARFFDTVDDLQKEGSAYNPIEIQTAIDEAVDDLK